MSFVWKSSTGVSALHAKCRSDCPSLRVIWSWFRVNTMRLTLNFSSSLHCFINLVRIVNRYKVVVRLPSISSWNTFKIIIVILRFESDKKMKDVYLIWLLKVIENKILINKTALSSTPFLHTSYDIISMPNSISKKIFSVNTNMRISK